MPPCVRRDTGKKVLALKVTGSRKALRALGMMGSFGFMMVASVVMGLIAGYYLDKWLGLENRFIVLGPFIGVIAGFIEFFRIVKVFIKDQDKE